MSDDRRATIIAAFEGGDDRHEQQDTSAQQTTVTDPASTEGDGTTPPKDEKASGSPATEGGEGSAPTGGDKKPVESSGEEQQGDKPAKTFASDKPPQSWRPAQKQKWSKLDPDVRQEIIRRERETETVLGNTANERKLAQSFLQTVQPFMARIQGLGVHPVVAVGELLKADHVLSTAPKEQRAALMAKLIKDYDIDVVDLDAALAGRQADPTESRVERMLQERLAPFAKVFETIQRNEEQGRQSTQAQINQMVASMSADTEKYPFFEDVREDMADLVELQAKKGVYLTLEQAYNRAVAMNPELFAQVAAKTKQAADAKSAQEANARAQRAQKASKSVGGAPGGLKGNAGSSSVNDRRSAISEAFDQLEGR